MISNEEGWIINDPTDRKPQDCCIEISGVVREGHPPERLVKIKMDGTMEFGEHYTPDAAAKVFWEAVLFNMPAFRP